MTDVQDVQVGNDDSVFKTTLGAVGPRLPIGIESNGQLLKDFDARKWRFKEEKMLGKYKADNPGVSTGEFITHLLSVMLVQLAGQNWHDSVPTNEKKVTISQMYLGDVLYMYLYLRKMALGSNIENTVLVCQNCRMKNERTLNLDDLDVHVVKTPGAEIQSVKLNEGIRIFGELRGEISIRPPGWSVMMDPVVSQSENEVERTMALIKSCVCGAEGIPSDRVIMITDEDVDELSKSDVVLLESVIDSAPGPQMAISVKCSKCGSESAQMIDYRYDSFFGIASTSQRMKS